MLNIKTAYVLNCVEIFSLKAAGICVILLSQDGFKNDCPETKFQTITS